MSSRCVLHGEFMVDSDRIWSLKGPPDPGITGYNFQMCVKLCVDNILGFGVSAEWWR